MKHTPANIATAPSEAPRAQEMGNATIGSSESVIDVRVHTMRTLDSSSHEERGTGSNQPTSSVQEIAAKLIQSAMYRGGQHQAHGQIETLMLIDALNRSMALRPGPGAVGKFGEASAATMAPQVHHQTQAPRHPTSAPTMRGAEPGEQISAPSQGRGLREQRAPDTSARELAHAGTVPIEARYGEHQLETLAKAIAAYQERAAIHEPRQTTRGEEPPALKPADGPVRETPLRIVEQSKPSEISPARESSSIVTPSIQATINETRNESARLINQILSGDLNQRPAAHSAAPSEQPLPLDPSLNAVRVSIATRLEQLRDNLQSVLEQTTPRQTGGEHSIPSAPATATNAIGDFTRTEAPTRATIQTNDLQREDRSREPAKPGAVDDTPTTRGAPREGAYVSAPKHPSPDLMPDGKPIDPHRITCTDESSALGVRPIKEGSLLESIAKLAEKITSIEALRKVDSALETAVIAAAAAATLGVLGGEILAKHLLELGRELLRYLNKDEAEDLSTEEVIAEIEEMCADRDIETIGKPAELVSDISGQVLHDETGQPVEGVIVDAGQLGSAITDINGVFIFKNVPLESGYTLNFIENRYLFNPPSVIGTVSTINHHSITATPKS